MDLPVRLFTDPFLGTIDLSLLRWVGQIHKHEATGKWYFTISYGWCINVKPDQSFNAISDNLDKNIVFLTSPNRPDCESRYKELICAWTRYHLEIGPKYNMEQEAAIIAENQIVHMDSLAGLDPT